MTACEVIQKEVLAASKAREKFLATGKSSDAKALRKAVEAAVHTACKDVFKKASRTPELAGMGTTVTVVLIAGHQKGILGHVGDSRAYLLRPFVRGSDPSLVEKNTWSNQCE